MSHLLCLNLVNLTIVRVGLFFAFCQAPGLVNTILLIQIPILRTLSSYVKTDFFLVKHISAVNGSAQSDFLLTTLTAMLNRTSFYQDTVNVWTMTHASHFKTHIGLDTFQPC
jgi:hypothetical protein